jgi:hypothetical protein
MHIFALAPEHVTFWWITLGLGAVVIAVVIVLLSLLVALVNDIDVNVKQVWETATRVAANTATTWMLNQAVGTTGELRAEVNRHAELLAARGGSR